MVRSGEQHGKFFPHSSSSLDIAQKKATFPLNEFAQGAVLISDLIIAVYEHNEWLIENTINIRRDDMSANKSNLLR